MNQRKTAPRAVVVAFESFTEVDDPRIDRTKLHSLMNILVMSLCAAIAGANGWDEMALFAEWHQQWFSQFLDLPYRTPSADTFRRVFEVLDPHELEEALLRWMSRMAESFKGEVIAIDGKSLKAAIETAGSTTPLHLLHAWATRQHLLLAQERVDGAPGEVRGIPELLKRLHVEGAIITTDANGCTANVTKAVRDAKADYVLALKGNRGRLRDFVKGEFEKAEQGGYADVPMHRSETKGHGRQDVRTVRAICPLNWPVSDEWKDLRTAVLVERTRESKGKTSSERHYYVSSLGPDAERLAGAIRSHWGIENNLHWVLDVAFDEDSRRIRDKRSATNFALLSRIALMMLKRHPARLSVAMKRKKAGWQPAFIAQVLASASYV